MAKDKDIKVIDGKVCVTSRALYELLDIAESTLVRWGQDGCPKIARGWWSIQDVLKWRGMSGGGGVKTADDIENKTLQEQKLYFETKLKEAQFEATDIKNAISRGDYIAKTEIISELQRFFVILKRSMDGFSRKVAAELAHFVDSTEARKMEAQIREVTNDALEQISINGIYDGKKAGKNKNS